MMAWLDHRILRNHIGLNYNFGINPLANIDSARVGNETRYLNHGTEDKVNARAESALSLNMLLIYYYSLRV
jgi:hypothetical protein